MRAGLVGGEGFAIDASVIEADASSGRKVDGKLTVWPETEQLTRPVREYLAALDRAAAAETAKTEDADNDMPPGNPPAPPKVTSLTDPTAAWTNKGQRKVGFAYGANYLIDLRTLPCSGLLSLKRDTVGFSPSNCRARLRVDQPCMTPSNSRAAPTRSLCGNSTVWRAR